MQFLKNFKNPLIRAVSTRYLSQNKAVILGIETSCDDTGCAIVNEEGAILGEALNSQQIQHLQHGGIIPTIAQDLHRKHIEEVVTEAVQKSGLNFNEIDAIAATVKPGLPLSLKIGMKYAKHLCRLHKKPFIPIHHMQAHALTARMHDKSIRFPFLVLLISGGHCLLTVAKTVDEFLLLGDTFDDAPGEAFDKMARRAKLRNLPEFSQLSGGQALEIAASRADNPLEFKFTTPLQRYKDCNFSLAGLKTQFERHLIRQEKILDLPPDGIIPNINNLSAGFQLVITRHLCHRLQRAIEFVALKNLIPLENQTLVVSGGVACNNFIAAGLRIVCDSLGYRLIRPPPKLCTDNGVMIAWNGMEKWKVGIGIVDDLESVDVEKSSPIGNSLQKDILEADLSPTWVRVSKLNIPQSDWEEDMRKKMMCN